MSTTTLLAELARAGIRLSRQGARLHVKAPPGTMTGALRQRLADNKSDLLLAMPDSSEATRALLLSLAESECLPAALVNGLDDHDLAGCASLGDAVLRSFLRALGKSACMNAGRVPATFTVATRCPQCGPVWLSEAMPLIAQSCPWCFRRKAGKPIPRPEEGLMLAGGELE